MELLASLEQDEELEGWRPEYETNNLVKRSTYPETQEHARQLNLRGMARNEQGSNAVTKIMGDQQTYFEREYWADISMEAVTIQMMPVRDGDEDIGENISRGHYRGWEPEESNRANEMHPIKEDLEVHFEVEEVHGPEIEKLVYIGEPLEGKDSLVKEEVKTAENISPGPSKRKSLSESGPVPKRKQNKTLLKQDEDEEKDDCPLCTQKGRIFSAGQGEMGKHFFEVHNIAEQGYECTECGFKTKERNHLVEHINVAHRQLQFCCDLCDYQTKYRNRIKSHKVSVHRVGGMPCTFPSCPYIAPEIWVLTQHKRAIHKDFGDKEADVRYKCNYCDYQATQRSHLKCHMAALHQQLVFCCDMCDFQSKWKSRMMAHTRAKHMGIFLFCDHCEFKTVEKHSLRVHVKKKHGDIQFACFSCDDNYITRIELRKHMSDVHYMQTL